MINSNKKKVILIGYGGMGKRYESALKELNFQITYICDPKYCSANPKNNLFVNDYKKLLHKDADLVCIVANTTYRFKILCDFILKSKIKKIITEKPLCCSLIEAQKLDKLIKKTKKRILINSYRPYLKNYLQIKKKATLYKEKFKSIIINSPSAGLGNMGSIYFDLAIFFLGEDIKSIYCKIDKKNTVNPRGKKFKDPGGYGIVNFKNNRLFFDTSEDTGLPYTFTIKTSNLEFNIDEINNKFLMKLRPNSLKPKPLYYYLFKPEVIKLKVYEKYNPINFTKISINKIFKNKFTSNIDESIKVMKLIIGCHLSSKLNKEIKFSSIKDQSLYLKFA